MVEVPAGKVSAPNLKLVAATVEEVKFAEYVPVVEIITDGTAEAYVTINGSVPTVGGSNCYVMPALATVRLIPGSGDRTQPPVVKMISAGTPTLSVSRADPRSILVAL